MQKLVKKERKKVQKVWNRKQVIILRWTSLIRVHPELLIKLSAIEKQESPASADKPARREIMPRIAPVRRAYNVVADNTGLSSFV